MNYAFVKLKSRCNPTIFLCRCKPDIKKEGRKPVEGSLNCYMRSMGVPPTKGLIQFSVVINCLYFENWSHQSKAQVCGHIGFSLRII